MATEANNLIARLSIGERLAQRRHDEISKVHVLARAANSYRDALIVGAMPGDTPEWHELLEAAYALFECDQLFEMAREASEPTEDLFGYDPRSLQSRIASHLFDEGKSA